MMTQHSEERKGYTSAIDYWSLGCTMFYLLAGRVPFNELELKQLYQYNEQHPDSEHEPKVLSTSNSSSNLIDEDAERRAHAHKFMRYLSSSDLSVQNASAPGSPKVEPAKPKVPHGYEEMLDITTDVGMSPEATSLITGLLHADEKHRLGSGLKGYRKIKKHPFFEGIVWSDLVKKKTKPPFLPENPDLCSTEAGASTKTTDSSQNQKHSSEKTLETIPSDDNIALRSRYEGFHDMLTDLGVDCWDEDYPNSSGQGYFTSWDYVSPAILRTELEVVQDAETELMESSSQSKTFLDRFSSKARSNYSSSQRSKSVAETHLSSKNVLTNMLADVK